MFQFGNPTTCWVNLVNTWHYLEFTKVQTIANWKDGTGITHLDTDYQTISLGDKMMYFVEITAI